MSKIGGRAQTGMTVTAADRVTPLPGHGSPGGVRFAGTIASRP